MKPKAPKMEKENAKEKPMFNAKLIAAISLLTRAISALAEQKHGLVTKQDLKEMEDRLLLAIRPAGLPAAGEAALAKTKAATARLAEGAVRVDEASRRLGDAS